VEIETMKKEIKATKDKLLYEMAENEKVRDNLDRATEYLNTIKLEDEADLVQLKKHFKEVSLGMNMTSTVMDGALKKFSVVKYNPLNEKFDPNLHEAIYTIPDPTKENNTVGHVMQTGWKIGERILRAAKVGINKK
jgi:molecular chaperone GrpE